VYLEKTVKIVFNLPRSVVAENRRRQTGFDPQALLLHQHNQLTNRQACFFLRHG
jgi:hypothetical protein